MSPARPRLDRWTTALVRLTSRRAGGRLQEMSDRVKKWPKEKWERMMEPGVSLWMRATDESTDELRTALVKANDHRPVVKVRPRMIAHTSRRGYK
eukprot:2476144-Pyramimonas_sp.AAC.1